jgi:pantetheine-phosphate adenylyltransferase
VAIYPGSFDPITNGHVDIIRRGLTIFDKVVVAVAVNLRKTPLFSDTERVELLRETFAAERRVEIDVFQGLLVEYARRRGVPTVLRGLRAVSDFEYEFQMASMNRRLSQDVDYLFMMTSEDQYYVSSTLIREVAANGGSVAGLVQHHASGERVERGDLGPAQPIGVGVEDLEDLHRDPAPLERHMTERAQAQAELVGLSQQRLRHEDARTEGLREPLEARGDVHGVAHHRRLHALFFADGSEHGLAAMNANADRERHREGLVDIERVDRALHRDRGSARPLARRQCGRLP